MTSAELKIWQDFGNELLAEHGLTEVGWVFSINRRKRAVGLCSYRDKTIYLSEHFLESDPDEIANTLLHEVAHALVGPRHHHNHVWRKMARSIGCTGDRCASNVVSTAEYNYTISCSSCGWENGRFRITAGLRRHVCKHCRGPITVTDNRL